MKQPMHNLLSNSFSIMCTPVYNVYSSCVHIPYHIDLGPGLAERDSERGGGWHSRPAVGEE